MEDRDLRACKKNRCERQEQGRQREAKTHMAMVIVSSGWLSEHPFGAQAFGSRTPGAQGYVWQGCRTQADRDVFTASLAAWGR
ncbi:MAG: hypothetical protein ACFCVA_09975, partial [Gammaproteobacteria bacterium]